MLQSIGALKSAIVVLSKHHSSLAQVPVLFGDSGTRARSVFGVCFCELGMADFRHRRKNVLQGAVHVDLSMLLSQAVFQYRFIGTLILLISGQPRHVYPLRAVARFTYLRRSHRRLC